ncbi:MAG: hypothetical protein Q8M76_07470 [Spirochaetaceae bacterium]|nr:hypothetical protein [Spirochaetaceae bacterium]
MHDRTAMQTLIQELKNDFEYIQENCRLVEKAALRSSGSSWADELDLMVVGASLHGLFNAFEAYFLRIAKFFENNVDQQSWHRDLLDRMTFEIPDVRPALITDRLLVERIDELRRFRHVFRNLYKTRLTASKLKIVYDAAHGIDRDFGAGHKNFLEWLELVARSMP